MEDFLEYIIKDYKYWALMVHSNQQYLGRCVVWCKREEALDLPDANEAEQKEFFEILKELKVILAKVFQPDVLNYSFLGNRTHHLHCHVIPRYSKPVVFEGVTFVDTLYGSHYQTDKDFVTSPDLLQSVKEKIESMIMERTASSHPRSEVS